MKQLRIALLVFFICLSVLAVVYRLYQRGYNSYFSFEQDRLNEIINGSTYNDILFIGSSRTIFQVNPAVVDSVTHANSYNAGMPGATLIEMNLLFKSYLKSHKPPKLLVADLATSAFDIEGYPFQNPTVYYQFLDNTLVYNTLKPYKRVFLLKNLPFLRLAEADDFAREGVFLSCFGGKKLSENQYYKGYEKNGTDTIRFPFAYRNATINYAISDQGIVLLNEIINLCRQNSIRIVFTYAPVYALKDAKKLNSQFFPTVLKLAAANNIPLLNYRQTDYTSDHRLFRDETHLNEYGSDIYSCRLSKDIVRFLK